ncbi:MAG: flagellar biosynthetic protein FliO [Gammaproteobacteria bacterium]|nr:flagellar biosynthetic protein FliO [Gammaproteobacteria bacterium]
MKQSTLIFSMVLALILMILFQEAIFANEAATENKIDFSESAVNVSSFLKMFLGLTAVVTLIFVLAWLSRKMKLVQNFASGYQIKNLASLSLTTREKICLIEVGDKQVLVGVAPGNVNQLHIFTDKIELDANSSIETSDNIFSKHLKKALGGNLINENSVNKKVKSRGQDR